MKRRFLWQAVFISVSGLLLGTAIVAVLRSTPPSWPWTPLFVLLGALAAWIQVPVAPYGSLNLSPLMFLVVAVVSDFSDGLLIAVMAPVLAAFASPRKTAARIPLEALAQGGEAGLSLVAARVFVNSFGNPSHIWGEVFLMSTLFYAALFLLQAMRISIIETVRLRKLLRPMLRSRLPHAFSVTVAAMLVSALFPLMGAVGVLLATVVIVEMYYPWKLLGEQRDLFMKSLQMISNAVDLKDPYTAHHSRRVSDYATKMARALDVPEEDVDRIRIGALMHDIGKIGVPGSIIRKPARLTDEEMEVMKNHVEAGAKIVEGLEILERSTVIVRHHHENFDGSGYPSGLAGDKIPLGSRIVFVADAFDALTTDRPYRKGRSAVEALGVLEANAPRQFDPKAVEALKKILGKLPT